MMQADERGLSHADIMDLLRLVELLQSETKRLRKDNEACHKTIEQLKQDRLRVTIERLKEWDDPYDGNFGVKDER